MNKNDNRILELKKQIKEKKSKLKKIKRFNPITTCNLTLDGSLYNIHVCTKDTLKLLLIKLNLYIMSAEDLSISVNDIMISCFSIEDWISDINLKLENMSIKEEESKLKVMEEKLTKLLSEEKKTELQIEEIESLLD